MPEIPESLVSMVQRSRARALFYEAVDPEVCLMHARKCGEGLLRCVLYRLGVPPAERLTFGVMWNRVLKDLGWHEGLNRTTKNQFESLNEVGNQVFHLACSSGSLAGLASGIVRDLRALSEGWARDELGLTDWPGFSLSLPGGLPPAIEVGRDLAALVRNLHERSLLYAEAGDYETSLLLLRKVVDVTIPPADGSGSVHKKGARTASAFAETAWGKVVPESLKVPLGMIYAKGSIAAHAHDREEDFDGLLAGCRGAFTGFFNWVRQELTVYRDEQLVAALPALAPEDSILIELDRHQHRKDIFDLWEIWPRLGNRLMLILPGHPEGGQERFLLYAYERLRYRYDRTLPTVPVKRVPVLLEAGATAVDLPHVLYEGLTGRPCDRDAVDKEELAARIRRICTESALLVHYRTDEGRLPLETARRILEEWEEYLPDSPGRAVIVAITWPLPSRTLHPIKALERRAACKAIPSISSTCWRVLCMPHFESFTPEEINEFLKKVLSRNLRPPLGEADAARWAKQLLPVAGRPEKVYSTLEKWISAWLNDQQWRSK